MKWLIAVLFACIPLFAQNGVINNPVIGQVYTVDDVFDVFGSPLNETTLFERLIFQIIRNPDGSKTFFFQDVFCSTTLSYELNGPSINDLHGTLESRTNCDEPVNEQRAEENANVQAQIGIFLDSYGDALHRLAYGFPPGPVGLGSSLRPAITTAAPTVPGDPYRQCSTALATLCCSSI